MSHTFTPAHPAPYQHYAPVIQVSTPPVLGLEDLSPLLKKSIPAILADRSRAPEKLPPECTPPGTKQPLWLLTDVLTWLAGYRAGPAPEAVAGQPRRRGRPTKAEQIERGRAAQQQGGA